MAGADRGDAGSKGGGVMFPHPVGLPRFLRPRLIPAGGANAQWLGVEEEVFFGEDPSDERLDDNGHGQEKGDGW